MNEAAYHAILRRLGVEPPALVARLELMPLGCFERDGCPLEVRVPWLSATLWWVPAEADAEALAQEGISRGRVWTARELRDLLSIPGLTTEQVETVARAKRAFGGEVVEVRERTPFHDPEPEGEPA